MTTPVTPMLVVGHGTRSEAGVAQFRALIERIARRHGAPPVVTGGFIELAPPPVQDAVRSIVDTGQRHLAAVPLVLAAAGHGKGDIPAALAREQARHPGLTYLYGRPLGPHPVLQEILTRRIDTALGLPDQTSGQTSDQILAQTSGQVPAPKRAESRDGVHVVLVGRGSTDPDANAEIAKVARLLYEGRGYAAVETSFVSLAEPGVPAALERVRRLGGERIVVAPYFLFPGVLPDRIHDQAATFADQHPDLNVRVADVIGDCDELADLALERYHEALHGDIRMNCDTCAYRIALPGFTDKVGRPQTPHDHPDDPAHPHGHPHPQSHSHGDPLHHGHDHDHDDHDHHQEAPDVVVHDRAMPHPHRGRVSLVGGGPGPDDLITVRARRLIDEADVLLVDRLAPQGLLDGLRDGVVVVDAAKHPRGHAMPQDEINRLLVEHARAGRRVVRLKGGDPYLFGRGHEELEACLRAGVPVEVVPGVSSALAVPAAAGVPVTHRGVAHELVVVSGHLPPVHPDSHVDWDALGRLSGTLVVLMGVASMPQIARHLIAGGRPAATPVLVVENGYAATSRTFVTTLDGVGTTITDERVVPPAVIVIGDVVHRRAVAADLAAGFLPQSTGGEAVDPAVENPKGTKQPAGVAGA